MKKALLVVLSCAFLASCATTGKSKYQIVNESEVPEKYSRDFHKRRADVESVVWQMVDSTCYVASFESNANQVSMKFKNTTVETSWLVPLEYTPTNITEYIEKNYEGYKLEEVNIVEVRNKKSYRTIICKKKECRELEFDLLGNFVKEIE